MDEGGVEELWRDHQTIRLSDYQTSRRGQNRSIKAWLVTDDDIIVIITVVIVVVVVVVVMTTTTTKKKNKKKKFLLICKGLVPYYFELKKTSNLRWTALLNRDSDKKLLLFQRGHSVFEYNDVLETFFE